MVTCVGYVTVDVFTDQRFAGSQLAVIPDARGLEAAAMQRIASEFNYSEVTFVLPPEDPGNTARVRIFTPTDEIPFAGHPNVGTAFVLGQLAEVFGRTIADTCRFEETAGTVEVQLLRNHASVYGARIKAPRELTVGPLIDPELIASCASLELDDICQNVHEPAIVSVGLPFAAAELTSLAALSRARPNAAALAAYLVSLQADPDLPQTIQVEQGVEMGRRSIIDLVVQDAGGSREVLIEGRCVSVMRESIEI